MKPLWVASQLWGPLPLMMWSTWLDNTVSSLHLARVSTRLQDSQTCPDPARLRLVVQIAGSMLCPARETSRTKAGFCALPTMPRWLNIGAVSAFTVSSWVKTILKELPGSGRNPSGVAVTGCHHVQRKRWPRSAQLCIQINKNPGASKLWRGQAGPGSLLDRNPGNRTGSYVEVQVPSLSSVEVAAPVSVPIAVGGALLFFMFLVLLGLGGWHWQQKRHCTGQRSTDAAASGFDNILFNAVGTSKCGHMEILPPRLMRGKQ